MISRSFIAALSAKFNILDVIDLPEVDSNFAILADRRLNTKKKYLPTRDRDVIGH